MTSRNLIPISFRRLLRAYWGDYALGIFSLLLTNACGAAIPLAIKGVIDGLSHHHQSNATLLLSWIAVLIIGMFVVRVLSRFWLIGVGRKIEFDTRDNLYQHLLSMPRAYFDVHRTGELMSRLTNDLTALRMISGGGVMLLANVFFAYLTIIPVMSTLSWRLTLFAFCLYPFAIIIMRLLAGRVKAYSHQVQDTLGDITAVAQENFSGIGVIQSYAVEAEESQRFKDKSQAYFNANIQLVKTRALLYMLIAAVSGLSILVILGEGGREAIRRELSLSSLTAFLLYLERLSWPTVSMGWMLSSLQQGIAAKERINRVFDDAPSITDAVADASLTAVPSGPITVSHLSFRYENPYDPQGSADRPWILNDISFTIPSGALVAIVGPIGAGKTTLLNLIARLYEAPADSIRLGDKPLTAYPLQVLRQGLTLMPQNSFLFSDTMRVNLAYTDPTQTMEGITAASRTAAIHDEIMIMPLEYETVVGERGVTLSGGQRQRSALARTLLSAPEILLLDDPFSSVDSHTETAIIAALVARHQQHGKTTVFASQRFALVQQADQIVVLTSNGHIDAIGPHDELMTTSELYRALNRSDEAEEVVTAIVPREVST